MHTDASTGIVAIAVRDFFDESQFKQILASAGIAAVFHEENVSVTEVNGGQELTGTCHWVGATVESGDVMTIGFALGASVVKIIPSRLLHGSVLAFNYETPTGGQLATSAQLLSNTPTGCVAD